MFITVPFRVRSITDENKPFQSGSVFYKCAKLCRMLYKHRVILTVDGRITLANNPRTPPTNFLIKNFLGAIMLKI